MSRRWRVALYAAVWILLLAFVARSVGRLPRPAEWAAMLAGDGAHGAAAFAACFALALVLRAFRFGYLVRKTAPIGWTAVAAAFPWLFMLGAVTPFRLGEAMRAQWVRRRGGSGAETLGLWVAERATDMLMLLCFGLFGLAFLPVSGGLAGPLLALLAVVVAVYAALSLGQGPLERLSCRLPAGTEFAEALLRGMGYMRRPREHAVVLVATLAIWTAMTAAFWAGLSLLLGWQVPLAMAALCMTAVNLAALLSAAPGNLGSFQAAGIAVLAGWGVDAGTALMATTVLQAAGLSVTLAAGGASWLLDLSRRAG